MAEAELVCVCGHKRDWHGWESWDKPKGKCTTGIFTPDPSVTDESPSEDVWNLVKSCPCKKFKVAK